jgi:hypothetical protein
MVRNPGFFRQVVRIVEACNRRASSLSRPPTQCERWDLSGMPTAETWSTSTPTTPVGTTIRTSTTSYRASLMPALKALVDRESLSEGQGDDLLQHIDVCRVRLHYLQAAGCTNVEMKSRWCSNMDMLHTRMGNGAANRSEKEFASCMELPVDVQRDGEGMDFPSVTTVIRLARLRPSCTRSASAALAEG